MKANEDKKKRIQLCGNLLYPLAIGQYALFKADGAVYRTSKVTAIHEVDTGSIRFETKNTHYHLLLSPYPAAVIYQFPLEPAACA